MATQPKAMYIQPDVIYSHLLIDGYNDVEPCIHLGLDDLDVVKRSYIEGETSKEIYTWHSDEKMKRIESQRDALLEALRALVQNEGLEPYSYLDKGIGTATAAGQRWLNARSVIAAAKG